MGQHLFAPMPDRAIGLQIVPPMFYDAQGARLHG
jgi:hypothetical protein